MDKLMHLLFWLLALVSPLNGVLTTIVFLIIVDFITGSYAALKHKAPICSLRIGHTISKFFIYNLVIISAYFLEKHIVNEVPFLKIIAGFIAITEIKSILENYNKIYGVNPFKALTNLIKHSSLKDTMTHLSNDKKKL
ncbi:phage holin family protein [Tenacibaculum maritimum]|uniref:phage holin family protein n=1 Tax=Tenacibaculum maritimum TaxID=107401 RepID=UPI0012E508B3|nr:phage holin family protein [Tenacibaculum maritimum]CAA0172007.1 Bacteriophage holin family protein [Tenacibaculum maritimum]CAA0237049.1 Bacteriophage holin family protein [Tenacibaculum maritimum]